MNMNQVILQLAEALVRGFEAWSAPWYWVCLAALLFVFGLIGLTPLRLDDAARRRHPEHPLKTRFRLICFKLLIILTVFVPAVMVFAGYLLYPHTYLDFVVAFGQFLWDGLLSVLGFPVVGYAMGTLVSLISSRFLVPKFSSLKRRFNVRQTGDELNDIRVETHRLTQKQFDPRTYYKEGHVFFGLDAQDQPIYETDADWKTRNQRYVGPTQTGKGVLLGVQLDQAIRHGYTVIFIDPKPDPHARAIMRQACHDTQRTFRELDLNSNDYGTYEMFRYGTERERRTRLFSALRLEDSGAESDFYRGRERAILDEVFANWDGNLASLARLLEDDEFVDHTIKTRNMLREWRYLPSLETDPTGPTLNLEEILLNNDVLYVAGSLTDQVVMSACTVLITEIIQDTMRLAPARPAHLFLAIDEVAFLVSERIADALATVSSFRTNVCLAYQSEGDLLTGPDMNTNWKAVAKRIQTNSKIHLYYRAEEFQTAQTIAEKSGTVIRNVTRSQRVNIGRHLEETWAAERDVHGVEEPTIHPNTALSLPERVGILFRPTELATPLFTAWVPVNPAMSASPAPPSTIPPPEDSPNELLRDLPALHPAPPTSSTILPD